MQAVESYEDFYARRGPEGPLVIGGTIIFSTGGWTGGLQAREGEGNTGINPFICFVNLVLTGPPAGTAATAALTPFELPEFKLERPELEYREVEFKVVGSEDAPPRRLSVEASGG